MRAMLLAVFCGAAMLGSSCSSSSDTSQDADAFEARVYDLYSPTYRIAVADLVTSCMRSNGFDEFREEIELPGQDDSLEPAPGLVGLDRIQEVGSGLIAIEQLAIEQELNLPPPAEDPPADFGTQEATLVAGPIATPSGIERSDLGCQGWAIATVENGDDLQERLSLQQAYNEFVEQNFTQSQRLPNSTMNGARACPKLVTRGSSPRVITSGCFAKGQQK